MLQDKAISEDYQQANDGDGIVSKHWLEETLQKSQERFERQPQWLQDTARNEDSHRRAEAHRFYGCAYIYQESEDGF